MVIFMAYNKSRRNKVYDYSYTVKYDMDSCLCADTSYVTDRYTSIISPYASYTKIFYYFTAYTMDYQAMVDLCNFIKSLPSVISCNLVQTYYGPYQLDFTLEGIYGDAVKKFMDNANRKEEIEGFHSYIEKLLGKEGSIESEMENETTFPNWSGGRRNGKEIEKNMQKFTPKKVIYSGGKTIVIWPDNSKTIVSCGDGDQYDEYAGFCAALAKKIFGNTSAAKRAMNKNKKVDVSKDLEEVYYEAIKKAVQNNLSRAIKESLNMYHSMVFEEKLDNIHSSKEKDDKNI